MNKQLKPSFYDKFRCIAEECESNCCSGYWGIFIDKKTYKKYMNLNGEIKKILKGNIKINSNHKSTTDYAKIKLRKNGKCSLLNDKGLCKIHHELGGDFLSQVCRMYPRENIKIGNLYEYKLTISCPEVARYVLLGNEKFSFLIDEKKISKTEEYYTSHINMEKNTFNLLWKVRSFAIEIVQMRDIELWKRIMILGLFCIDVDKNLKSLDRVIDEIDKYRVIINNNEVLDSLENIKVNNDKKLSLVTQFIKSRVDYVVHNKDFIEICNNLDSLIGLCEENSKEDIVLMYKKLENEVYKEFLSNNSHILENYLVNSIYRDFVYFYKSKSFYDRFIKIIIQYSIVRFLLMGQLGTRKEHFNNNDIIKVFYSFSREIEHNHPFMNMLIEGLKQKGYDKLNYMSILIRE